MSLPLQNLPLVGLPVKSASMVVGVLIRDYRRVGARDQFADTPSRIPKRNDGSTGIFGRGGGTPPVISYECERKRVAQKAFCKCMKTIGDILVALRCCGVGAETPAGL